MAFFSLLDFSIFVIASCTLGVRDEEGRSLVFWSVKHTHINNTHKNSNTKTKRRKRRNVRKYSHDVADVLMAQERLLLLIFNRAFHVFWSQLVTKMFREKFL